MGNFTKVPLTNKSVDPGPPYADADWFNRVDDGVDRAHQELDGHEERLDALEATPAPTTNLDALSDVELSSPTNGQVLKYNGTNWTNAADLQGMGGTGGSAVNVERNDVVVVEGAAAIDFSVAFDVTADPAGEANVTLGAAYTKGMANGVAPLGADNKIPAAHMPALAINDIHQGVASEAAMIALVAQRGDVAIRTDFEPDRMYMLATDNPSVVANWVRVTFGDVVSVQGSASSSPQTGAVVLGAADVGAAPSSHVGAGGAAHANAVAGGAAGFMSGQDKQKLDGLSSSGALGWASQSGAN